jgi:hypothetical protein
MLNTGVERTVTLARGGGIFGADFATGGGAFVGGVLGDEGGSVSVAVSEGGWLSFAFFLRPTPNAANALAVVSFFVPLGGVLAGGGATAASVGTGYVCKY